MNKYQFREHLNACTRQFSPPIMTKWCEHLPKESCRCNRAAPIVTSYPGQKHANLRKYYIEGPTKADDSDDMSFYGATQWRWRRIYEALQKRLTADELAEAFAAGFMDLPAADNVAARGTPTHKNLRLAHHRAVRKASDAAKRDAKRRARADLIAAKRPATPQDAQTIADRHGMTLDAALYVITGF